jgi:hypothetical protein
MSRLKISTARSKVVFMTDSTDHVTGKTGLTLTITASKDGGSFASISPTVTELATGWYKLALTTSHTDTAGDLALHITATGADPTDVVWEVESVDQFSALTGDAYARLGAPAGASVSADVAAIKAETASILTDTAEIGAAGAGLTALATQASVNTIDTVVDAILVDTGTDIPATLSTIAGYIDTEVAATLAAVDTEVAAIKAKTDSLTFTVAGQVDSNMQSGATGVLSASLLASDAANEIADALLDRANGIETGLTPRQAWRLESAAAAGKVSGAATTTVTIRNAVADSKARITATVDADGNRSAITTDVT